MRSNRYGFTLVELLVVIGILLLLTYFTVSLFRNDSGSKMREAARIGQAAILGARDRALHAKEKRGFRLLLDPTNNNLATGIIYVTPIAPLTYSPVEFDRVDDGTGNPAGPAVTLIRGTNTDWYTLWQTGMFSSTARVRIPAATGQWFQIVSITQSGAVQTITISTDASGVLPVSPGLVAVSTAMNVGIDLEVANELTPNMQPISLPSGVVIDLSRSTTINGDLMFSPRGMITGPAAAQGPIFLMLRDVRDVGADPSVAKYDQQVLTLFPQTGHVASYPVDMADAVAPAGVADHPFYFAQTGSNSGG